MWDWEVKTKQPWFKFGIRELFHHKDLILRFSKRDLLASYQQTLIGPLWVVIQPLLTTLTYVLIFSRVARISTDDIPPFLFYLPGIILWNYFSECLNGTMNTFQYNANIFSKVFFPRLTVPTSQVLTSSFRMVIQLLIFILIYAVYAFNSGLVVNKGMLLLPVSLLLCVGFAVGFGLIVSIATAKYKDLDTVLQFVLRLFMFATPVIYPSSIVPPDLQWLFWLNPLTPAIETLRYAFFGSPAISWWSLSVSVLNVGILCIVGLIVFKRNEIKVMDTV
jgi:lipopolysaccharide transport system permease protein